MAFALALGVVSFSLVAAPAAASEAQGDLTLSGQALISGTFTGQGQGEVRLFPGPQLGLHGEATRVVVEEYTFIFHLVATPLGPVSFEDHELFAEREEYTFDRASVSLEAFAQGFEGLIILDEGDEGLLHLSANNLNEVPLVAYRDPGILLDERGANPIGYDGGSGALFTYEAPGDRFMLPAQRASGHGDPSLYLWEAEFLVEPENGASQRFVSGEKREHVAPGYEQVTRTYYIVTFEDGSVQTTGAHVAWLADPSLQLLGVLASEKTEGTLVVDGGQHRIDQMPLIATGQMALHPRPAGDLGPVPNDDSTHIGTSGSSTGMYDASRVSLQGSHVTLLVGSRVLETSSSTLVPVAATAGIIALLGAALALTPQGKWAILGALAPLYAKTQRDRLLESPQRERLLQAIQANPGVHLSGLRELAELGWGTTVYHLRLMEKRGLIASVARAGQRHFFVKTPGVDAARLRTAVSSIVGQDTAHKVAFAVLSVPGSSQKEISERLGVSRRVVAHHIARLHKADLVEKKRDGSMVLCYPSSALGEALAMLDTPGGTSPVSPMQVHPSGQPAGVPVEG